jgi:hypothetical protein
MPVEITCKRCGTKKMVKPYLVDPINGNYCSRSCMGKDRVGDKNPFYGKKHTEASKEKNSKSCMGRNGADNGFFGKTHTGDTKDKISEKQKENFEDPEYKEKFHNARVEMWKDPTYRENKIRSLTEQILSEDRKKKIGEAQKKCWEDKEYRIPMTIKRKQAWENNFERRLRKSEQMSGDKNYFWKGGKSFEQYPIEFNEEFKERVREYFGRICIDCGMGEEENGAKLSVHHIEEDKTICCDGSELSYVPLCKSCHRAFHTTSDAYKKDKYINKIINNFNGKCYYTKEEYYKN